MFVRIDNTPRDYAWGSTTAIARLLGREASGGPEAELWLGAHDGSPARVLDADAAGGAANLADWIRAQPEAALGASAVAAAAASGSRPRLPFLLKVLAAAAPLSLQAHPSSAQAAAGFARENAAGVPLDAPDRNYKDAFHKPEMIFALSDTFHALCGFRAIAATESDLRRLTDAAAAAGRPASQLSAFAGRLAAGEPATALRDAVEWLLAGPSSEAAALLAETVAASKLVLAECGADDYEAADALDPVLRPFATVVSLDEAYPGDPGVVLSLLLNRVTLRRGQALYLPAGNIHAYLEGLGIELMASSDNVLRGGLTPKHVDVPELLSVLDVEPLPAPLLEPVAMGDGLEEFRPDVPDFRLLHRAAGSAPASVALAGPAIVLATSGSAVLTGPSGSIALARGGAVYVTPDETPLHLAGDAEIFVATVGEITPDLGAA